MSRDIPVGRHGTGHRGERLGGAEAGRRVLRAGHSVRHSSGVRVVRLVRVRVHSAVRAVGRSGRRFGCHIA